MKKEKYERTELDIIEFLTEDVMSIGGAQKKSHCQHLKNQLLFLCVKVEKDRLEVGSI